MSTTEVYEARGTPAGRITTSLSIVLIVSRMCTTDIGPILRARIPEFESDLRLYCNTTECLHCVVQSVEPRDRNNRLRLPCTRLGCIQIELQN